VIGVAKRYVALRRDEPMLLPPDPREWLAADHLVWFLLDVIRELDTSAFHRRAKLGGAGRAPYDPDMLLAVLVYAYAGGLRSSRKIERRCREDVAFMVLSGLCYPDHVTIARFRKDHDAAMADLFDRVLALCFRAGLGDLEHVAIDGTKMVADAAPVRTRDLKGLRGTGRRWLDEAAAVDDAEDARFGPRRGDELPEELADPARRQQVIADLINQAGADPDRRRGRSRQRKARHAARALELADEVQAEAQARAEPKLDKAEQAVQKLEASLAKARTRVQARNDARARRDADATAQGRVLPGKRPVPVEEHFEVRTAQQRLDKARQRLAAQRDTPVQATGQRNLTDPDARFMPTQHQGFILGYNTQLAVSADHLILAYLVVQQSSDMHQLTPMFDLIDQKANLARAVTGNPVTVGLVTADAGYASEANLTADGPDRLIALGKQANIAGDHPPTGPPGEHATAMQKMARRLATPQGRAAYNKRGATVEPVNSHLKQARGLRRFSQRGLPAARAEVALAALTTNLLRLFTTKARTLAPQPTSST
jgi:transposase